MSLIFLLSSCSSESVTPNTREPAAALFSVGQTLKMRFQIEPYRLDQGVRIAEYRTGQVDVTYKVLKAEPYSLKFKVYVSNVGKSVLRLDSSLFNITSVNDKKIIQADKSLWADEKKPVAKVTLQPGESASSELRFPVNEALGRWILKNKLTSHSFIFMVENTN